LKGHFASVGLLMDDSNLEYSVVKYNPLFRFMLSCLSITAIDSIDGRRMGLDTLDQTYLQGRYVRALRT